MPALCQVRQKTQGQCVCRAADAGRVAALALELETGGKGGKRKGGKGGPPAAGVAAAFIGSGKHGKQSAPKQQSFTPAAATAPSEDDDDDDDSDDDGDDGDDERAQIRANYQAAVARHGLPGACLTQAPRP